MSDNFLNTSEQNLEFLINSIIQTKFYEFNENTKLLHKENEELREKCLNLEKQNQLLISQIEELKKTQQNYENAHVMLTSEIRNVREIVENIQCPNLGKFTRKLTGLEKEISELGSKFKKVDPSEIQTKISSLENMFNEHENSADDLFMKIRGELENLKNKLQTEVLEKIAYGTCPNIARILQKFGNFQKQLGDISSKVNSIKYEENGKLFQAPFEKPLEVEAINKKLHV